MAGPGFAVLGARRFGLSNLIGLVLRICFVVCMMTTIVLGVAPPR